MLQPGSIYVGSSVFQMCWIKWIKFFSASSLIYFLSKNKIKCIVEVSPSVPDGDIHLPVHHT